MDIWDGLIVIDEEKRSDLVLDMGRKKITL